MFTLVKDINVGDLEEGLPALLTMILMPLTYSITNGIGAGFIALVATLQFVPTIPVAGMALILGVIAVVCAFTLFAMLAAERLNRLIGVTGSNVIARVSGSGLCGMRFMRDLAAAVHTRLTFCPVVKKCWTRPKELRRLSSQRDSLWVEAGGNAIDAGVAAGIALGVLQTDRVNFAGVAPIMMYLAEKAGKFYPQDLRTRYDVNQWLTWQMANQGPKSGECGHFRRVDQAKDGEPAKTAHRVDAPFRVVRHICAALQGTASRRAVKDL